MTGLLGAELTRLVSRRLYRVLVGLFLLGAIVVGVVRAAGDDPVTLSFVLDFTRSVGVSSMPLFGIILGASFIGAEWSKQTMETLLTWEPRRERVFVAKIGVGAALLFVSGVILSALYLVALLPAATMNGFEAGQVSAGTLVAAWARAGGIAAFAGVFAMAWAMGFRNTAGAIAIPYVYLTILEPVLSALRPGWRDWLIGPNLGAATGGGFGGGGLSGTRAGLLLAGYAVGLAVLAYASFRYRDVT